LYNPLYTQKGIDLVHKTGNGVIYGLMREFSVSFLAIYLT